MKLELFPFQSEAVASVVKNIEECVAQWNATRELSTPVRTAFALSSVTGSGKTIIAATVLESLISGSIALDVDPIPGATVLWVNYDPALNKQTRSAFMRYADRIPTTSLHEIDSTSFNDTELRAGHVYFLSLPLLGGSNLLGRATESRDYTFWDVLARTVDNPAKTLIVVVDEAHIGMGGAKRTSSSDVSILQRIITGSGAYSGAPVTWGISATPKRFRERLSVLESVTTRADVIVAPRDVQNSGLLKRSISLFVPDESVGMEVTMMYDAMDELNDSTRAWASYCDGSPGEPVVPLAVMQLPHREDGKDTKAEDAMIAQIVAAARTTLTNYRPGCIAHVIPDRGDIHVAEVTVSYIDPDVVSSQQNVRVLIAKDSISTGWDCPRAEILLSLRPTSDETTITQMLGRMVRTPLARSTDVDILDRVSCWVPKFNTETALDVVAILTGEKEPDGREKLAFKVDKNPEKIEVALVSDEEFESYDDESVIEDESIIERPASVIAEASASTPSLVDIAAPPVDTTRPAVTPSAPQLARPTPVESEAAPSEQLVTTSGQPASTDDAPATQPRPIATTRPVVRPQRGIGVSALAALNALPTVVPPSGTRVKPTKRLRDLVVRLAENKIGGAINAACDRRIIAEFSSLEMLLSNEIAAAHEEITTASMVRVHRVLSDGEHMTTKVRRRARHDVINTEFERSLKKLNNEPMVYLKHLAASDSIQNEFALKARIASIVNADGFIDRFEDMCDRYATELLNTYTDDIALLPSAVQGEFVRIAREGLTPVWTKLHVGLAVTRSKSVSDILLPKNVHHDANGMWPVPASIAKNKWEMAVLRREVERDAVKAWYRNPPTSSSTESLTIPYQRGDGTWGMDQPDFIFIERVAEGYKCAIVNPHWLADADGLLRIKAFAQYAEDNAELLTRADQIAALPGTTKLLRLSLAKPSVRDAVRQASSVEGLFESVGIEYPLS